MTDDLTPKDKWAIFNYSPYGEVRFAEVFGERLANNVSTVCRESIKEYYEKSYGENSGYGTRIVRIE